MEKNFRSRELPPDTGFTVYEYLPFEKSSTLKQHWPAFTCNTRYNQSLYLFVKSSPRLVIGVCYANKHQKFSVYWRVWMARLYPNRIFYYSRNIMPQTTAYIVKSHIVRNVMDIMKVYSVEYETIIYWSIDWIVYYCVIISIVMLLCNDTVL